MDWEVHVEVVVAVCVVPSEVGCEGRSITESNASVAAQTGKEGANIRMTMGIYDKAEDTLTKFWGASVISTPPWATGYQTTRTWASLGYFPATTWTRSGVLLMTVKCLMERGAVEVNETRSRGVSCSWLLAVSSGPNTNARVTLTTRGNTARKDWEMRKLTERWVMLESGADEERSNGGMKDIYLYLRKVVGTKRKSVVQACS